MGRRLEKLIVYCGQRAKVVCDGLCEKAFGINGRPRVPGNTPGYVGQPEDDYAWLADDEVGIAPTDPGTYEGGHAKPQQPVTDPEQMNKWCVRECERCEMSHPGEADLPLAVRDFSTRHYNVEPHTR